MTQSQLQVAALTCCKGTKSSRDHGPRHSTTWETVQILGCSLGVKSHLETTMMVVECSRIVLYPVGGAVPIPAVTTIAYPSSCRISYSKTGSVGSYSSQEPRHNNSEGRMTTMRFSLYQMIRCL